MGRGDKPSMCPLPDLSEKSQNWKKKKKKKSQYTKY
jgi:hypothetical protein